jgi:hypothetical protein
MDIDPPIAYGELRALFEYLDRVSGDGYKCDHTLAKTAQFLASRQLAVQTMLEWLGENGAGCDCEVMFNVAQQWEQKVGYVPEE